jgi:WD40 repeat protein
MSRPDAASPYKGLASFTEDDTEWFFGRDAQVEITATNLMSARITVFYGESGVGKTSLLRAGVVPLLREEAVRDASATGRADFAVALHNQWQGDAIPELVSTVRAAGLGSGSSGPAGAEPHLDEVLAEVTSVLDSDLLLIFDQFEEWFLYHSSGRAIADSELLRAMGRVDLPVHYLISLRQDALAQLDRFKGRVPGLFENLVRLRHLDRGGARLAIERPLERYNAGHPGGEVEIEPQLVERVLEGVRTGAVVVGEQGQGTVRGNGRDASSERIEAPFLQLVMTRLWDEERAADSSRLRVETLDALGGAERIIRTHLDQTMEATDPDHQALAAEAFKYLVTPSGAKIAHSAGDLAEYTGVPAADLERLLDVLARRRILRPVRLPIGASALLGDDGDVTRYEIFHDVLAAPILDWRRRREEAERANRLERERESARQDADRERRRARAFRAIALALVATLVLTVVTAAIALDQRSTADRERSTADRERRVAQNAAKAAIHQARNTRNRALLREARAAFPIDPLTGLMLTIKAASVLPDQVAGGMRYIRDRTTTVPFQIPDPSEIALPQATFSPDGSRVAVVGSDGLAGLFDTQTGRRVLELPSDGSTTSIAFSRDGGLFAAGSEYARIRVWDASTGRAVASATSHGELVSLGFSPDGRFLITAGPQDGGTIWNARTGQAIRHFRIPNPQYCGTINTERVRCDVSTFEATFASSDMSYVTLATVGKSAFRAGRSDADIFHPGLGYPYAGAVSSDGRFLVTLHAFNRAAVWRLAVHRVRKLASLGPVTSRGALRSSARWITTLTDDTAPLTSALFSQDATKVITASIDGTGRIWNARTGAVLTVLRGHRGPVMDAEFDRNARYAVSAGADGTVRVWNASTGAQVRVIHVTSSGIVLSAAFSPDGSSILTDTANGVAQIWNMHTGHLIFTLRA